jgi:predicted nucleic acid-binding protein
MLLDTSGLYCYLDRADARHAQAISLLDGATKRLTHNYVLAELVALCSVRRIDRQIAIEFVAQLADDPTVTVVWVTKDDHRSAIDLLRARPDKDYSLCDAVSFVLMRRHGVNDALTTDRHFEQEGFARLLRI